jgi:MraZ protein
LKWGREWVTIALTWGIVGASGIWWLKHPAPPYLRGEPSPGMFYGEYEHNLDEKGRITVPATFRDAFDTGVFVTRGPEGSLLIFDLPTWEDLSRKLRRESISRHIARMLFSGARAQLDNHGRILIPAGLRAYAGLQPAASVVVVGVDDRLELWNKERWDALTTSVVESGEFIAGLSELGL